VSLVLIAIYTSGLIKWVEQYASVKGLSFVDDLGWVVTGSIVNQVFTILERCSAQSIEWAGRRGLQCDTAKTEAALRTCRRGHKKHLRPKLIAKTRVRDGFIQFNRKATRWLAIWMDSPLTFNEHHNRCIKKAWAAAARLRTLTKTYKVQPGSVRAIQVACVQAVPLYGQKLAWDPNQAARREDLQLLLNRQGRSILSSSNNPTWSVDERLWAYTRSRHHRIHTAAHCGEASKHVQQQAEKTTPNPFFHGTGMQSTEQRARTQRDN